MHESAKAYLPEKKSLLSLFHPSYHILSLLFLLLFVLFFISSIIFSGRLDYGIFLAYISGCDYLNTSQEPHNR